LLLIACEPDISQLIIHKSVGKHGQQRTIFRALALQQRQLDRCKASASNRKNRTHC